MWPRPATSANLLGLRTASMGAGLPAELSDGRSLKGALARPAWLT